VGREHQPPTGERIASEIERELQDGLYPLRHVTLAPAEYHVYLHPDDFAHVELVVGRIVEDVQACLSALVERMNRRTAWARLTMPPRPPVEMPAGGWIVHVKPALNDEVGQGQIGLESRLSVPQAFRFGTGAGTVRITETLVTGAERRSRTHTRTIAAEPSPTATPLVAIPALPVPDDTPLLPARPITVAGPRLVYRDDTGDHTYAITKELTKIGRGGTEHWVDVMVTTGPQVSREHCRIRRDLGGRLFLQDVSAWGTFVNGRRLQPASTEEGATNEEELSHGTSIRLADAVTLELLLR
jgi:hypothetical protein